MKFAKFHDKPQLINTTKFSCLVGDCTNRVALYQPKPPSSLFLETFLSRQDSFPLKSYFDNKVANQPTVRQSDYSQTSIDGHLLKAAIPISEHLAIVPTTYKHYFLNILKTDTSLKWTHVLVGSESVQERINYIEQ